LGDLRFLLEGANSSNHVKEKISNPTFKSPLLTVSASSQVITMALGTLSNFSLTVTSSAETVNVDIYRKGDDTDIKLTQTAISLGIDEDGEHTISESNLSNWMSAEGTYRLVFTNADGSVTCQYYMIVVED